jgi:hypothetical protein
MLELQRHWVWHYCNFLWKWVTGKTKWMGRILHSVVGIRAVVSVFGPTEIQSLSKWFEDVCFNIPDIRATLAISASAGQWIKNRAASARVCVVCGWSRVVISCWQGWYVDSYMYDSLRWKVEHKKILTSAWHADCCKCTGDITGTLPCRIVCLKTQYLFS